MQKAALRLGCVESIFDSTRKRIRKKVLMQPTEKLNLWLGRT